jgi:hypothetical protein
LTIDSYVCKVAFNVIKSPNNFIILGQNWLEFYNPKIDWKGRKLIFEYGHSTIEQATFESCSQGKNQKIINLRKEVKVRKNQSKFGIKGIRPLIVGARAFLRATKEGTSFAIYATPIKEDCKSSVKLPTQYEDFIDIFEKKKLTCYQIIDLMIVLLICNMELSLLLDQFIIYQKMNLLNYVSILTKTLVKNLFDTQSHQLGHLYYL